MSDEIKLTADAADTVARFHEQAAHDMGGSADGLPSAALDAGEAAVYIEQIIATVTKHAVALAKANSGAASIVKEVGNDFAATEDETETRIERLRSRVDAAS